ncbi:response regulator [Panacibacter sp. DH6]|uniref:Response regulator n=1 Tax=Panacibacter microcysteis TaxID=2793269 RepID=A0A931E7A5_9BACT|nr:response regulator [Panacibacter microcysteis]MBG9375061.1 response regulator [Panacibacter microcysteis]
MKPGILLVDDHEDILQFLSSDLEDKYSIYTAANGREALNILEKESVQLVISDVMMPVMDGFELCKAIKTNFNISHIPVILLTAKNTLQSKIEGLETGADAYIEKPFSPGHLHAQITSLLSNRNKLKEHFANSPLVHINSIAYTRADEKFLEDLNNAIVSNLENAELDVEQLAKMMNMSRPTFYRKIKAVSDLTPNDLINITRLKKAAALLLTGGYKIYEVADMVGFNSQTNFARSFLKQFGVTPSDYVNLKGSRQN